MGAGIILICYTPPLSWELHRVTIVGGGMMGRSLATKVAQEGINVYLKEVSAEAVASAQRELERSLDHSIERFALTGSEKKAILSRITWVTHFDCATDCDLALEAVQEDFGLKRQILRELDRRMPPDHPIVLTTSTLSITELAAQNTSNHVSICSDRMMSTRSTASYR